MAGSKLYDLLTVANAAASVASRNLKLQKASSLYCISSQRTLLSIVNPFSQKFNIDLAKSSTPRNYEPTSSPTPPSPTAKVGSNPLGFDRRPNITQPDIDTQLKREYSTNSNDDKTRTKEVIGSAPKKDVC